MMNDKLARDKKHLNGMELIVETSSKITIEAFNILQEEWKKNLTRERNKK